MINPKLKDRLEKKVLEALSIRSTIYNQFIRYRNLIILSVILRKWGISFKIILQKPGDIVTVCRNTYHYKINLDLNLAEAINYATADYDPPRPLYTPCSRRIAGCPPNNPILPSDLERDELRLLNIDVKWEYGAPAEDIRTKARTKHQLKRPIIKCIHNPINNQKTVVTRSQVATEKASKPPVEQEQSGIESSNDKNSESLLSLGFDLSALNGCSSITAVYSSVDFSALLNGSSIKNIYNHNKSDLFNRVITSDASELYLSTFTEIDSTDTGFTPLNITPAILDLQTSLLVDLLQVDPSDSGADKQSDLDSIEDPSLLIEKTASTADNHINIPDLNRETRTYMV